MKPAAYISLLAPVISIIVTDGHLGYGAKRQWVHLLMQLLNFYT